VGKWAHGLCNQACYVVSRFLLCFLSGNRSGQTLFSGPFSSNSSLCACAFCQCAGADSPGHVNEKNFVGLAVNGDFVACGSETNEVFAYYKVRVEFSLQLGLLLA